MEVLLGMYGGFLVIYLFFCLIGGFRTSYGVWDENPATIISGELSRRDWLC